MSAADFRIQRPFSKWKVRPLPGEGASSYFVRLVRDQGHPSPTTYAQAIGLPASNLGARQLLGALASLPISAEEKSSLERWTPISDGAGVSLDGIFFPNRLLSAFNHRHCPECIAEAPFHRAWWNLVGFETCPKHMAPLTRWTAEPAHRFWPPFYGPSKPSASAEISSNSINPHRFESYLLGRLGVVADFGPPRPLLDENPLDDVIWYAGGVGRLLNNPRRSRRPPKGANDHQRGFEAICLDHQHLVEAFSRWLVVNNTAADLQQASNHTLGWGNALVQIKSYSRDNSVLGREVALAQALACSKVGKVGSQHRGYKGLDAWPISSKRVGVLLGVTEGGIRVLASKIGRNGRSFDREDLDEMEALLGRTCSSSEALRALACSESQLRVLTSKGIVGRIYIKKSRRYWIFKDDLDALVEKLDGLPLALGDEVDIEEFARRNAISASTVMIAFVRGKYQGRRSPPHSGFRKLRLPSAIRAEPRTRGGAGGIEG
jgi:hypothetical protein